MTPRILVAVLAIASVEIAASAQALPDDAVVLAWMQSFDRAFGAKDLDALKARSGGREVDSAGLETLVLVKSGGAWKIRHSHISGRRRPPPGPR